MSRVLSPAASDKALKVWDAQVGVELATLEGHTEAVTACDFSQHSDLIASASTDKTLRLWDAPSFDSVFLTGHAKGSLGLCIFSRRNSACFSVKRQYSSCMGSGDRKGLEAIVALPTDMFYNTGISTYIWLLTNHKAAERKGKLQLINAAEFFRKMRKSLGS